MELAIPLDKVAVSKAAVSNIETQVLPGTVSRKILDGWGVWGKKRKSTLKAIVF